MHFLLIVQVHSLKSGARALTYWWIRSFTLYVDDDLFIWTLCTLARAGSEPAPAANEREVKLIFIMYCFHVALFNSQRVHLCPSQLIIYTRWLHERHAHAAMLLSYMNKPLCNYRFGRYQRTYRFGSLRRGLGKDSGYSFTIFFFLFVINMGFLKVIHPLARAKYIKIAHYAVMCELDGS